MYKQQIIPKLYASKGKRRIKKNPQYHIKINGIWLCREQTKNGRLLENKFKKIKSSF